MASADFGAFAAPSTRRRNLTIYEEDAPSKLHYALLTPNHPAQLSLAGILLTGPADTLLGTQLGRAHDKYRMVRFPDFGCIMSNQSSRVITYCTLLWSNYHAEVPYLYPLLLRVDFLLSSR